MNVRTDIVRMYRDIHSWVGIVSGLALFIAFYAGAITMFEEPLQRWASPPPVLAQPVPLAESQTLIDAVLAAHPEAAKNYQIVVDPGPENPARMNWTVRGPDRHTPPTVYYAALGPDGALEVTSAGPSQVAQLVDVLHQQVGLPFDHEISMIIMGGVALLYAIALVSGVFVLLPSLVKDLFILRISHNLKRMWLDVHNALGLFSLPFHIVMALTAVVFAYHDLFYGAQGAAFYRGDRPMFTEPPSDDPGHGPDMIALSPQQVVERLAAQAPDFQPRVLNYHIDPGHGLELRVGGTDPRYGHRGPTMGFAGVDPFTGDLETTDYMPGLQDGWFATITGFFSLHFGNFGGTPVRWGYFVLGLAGALLFYTGNLLWVESHRKKRRKSNPEVTQTRASYALGALTVGVSLGCIAGISLTIAAAKVLPHLVDDVAGWHTGVYYAVFVAGVVWAFVRGAARGAVDLLYVSAIATLCIPAVSLISALVPDFGWNNGGATHTVDVVACIGAFVLVLLAGRTTRRIHTAPTDSIWYVGENSASVPTRTAEEAS